MSDLRFSQECDVAVEQLKDFARRLNGDLYGNGRKGFMEEVRRFIDEFNATEIERDKHQEKMHQENRERLEEIDSKVAKRSLIWTVAGVFVAAAALAVGALAIIVMVKIAHADLREYVPFNHSTMPPTYDARN